VSVGTFWVRADAQQVVVKACSFVAHIGLEGRYRFEGFVEALLWVEPYRRSSLGHVVGHLVDVLRMALNPL
jgi:hypothetical protein